MTLPHNGLFYTFEGIDGCGKSTQINLLKDKLSSIGIDVLLTREPGGTSLAESIRGLLLDSEKGSVSKKTELLLYLAARAQHVEQVICPALKAGKVVLCDRFMDSTIAYQGGGRSLPLKDIQYVNRFSTSGLIPTKTFLLDLPAKVAATRVAKSGREKDRIEKEGLLFQESVRKSYLALAETNKKRIVIIDAKLKAEKQAEIIFKNIKI